MLRRSKLTLMTFKIFFTIFKIFERFRDYLIFKCIEKNSRKYRNDIFLDRQFIKIYEISLFFYFCYIETRGAKLC